VTGAAARSSQQRLACEVGMMLRHASLLDVIVFWSGTPGTPHGDE